MIRLWGCALCLVVACRRAEPEPQPPPPTGIADALVHRSRSPTSAFWESTDAAARGDVAYVCTGVSSLTLHDMADPDAVEMLDEVRFPLSSFSFPRCSHVDVLGDRLIVASRNDEVQPEAWVALVDVARPRHPVTLDAVGYGEQLVEEATLTATTAWVAATGDGLIAYDISGDALVERGRVPIPGTAIRVDRAPGGGVAVGTAEGQVVLVGEDLQASAPVDVGAQVMGLEALADGRLALALGSSGLGVLDPATGALEVTDTRGTALRLHPIDDRYLAVANWSDLRVFDVSGPVPELRAVDAVYESEDRPRTFSVAASGDRVVAATWTGVHVLTWDPAAVGPEITLSTSEIAAPADGGPHDATVVVTNEGQLPLHVTDLKTPGPWTGQPRAFTLEPGQAQEVAFHTDGSAAVSLDEARFLSDDPDEPKARLLARVGADAVFVGDPALDFTYVALNTGTTHTLSEQRGKVVLLSYFATF